MCTSDEIPVGFAGWTLYKGIKKDTETVKGNDRESWDNVKRKKVKNIRVKLPEGLDVYT